eukprot:1161247-Pelagomonas_calceolata.AAC.2
MPLSSLLYPLSVPYGMCIFTAPKFVDKGVHTQTHTHTHTTPTLVWAKACKCGACYLQPIKRLLATQFPDMNMLETASLHKGITGSQHEFVSQQAGRDRLDLLSEVRFGDVGLV